MSASNSPDRGRPACARVQHPLPDVGQARMRRTPASSGPERLGSFAARPPRSRSRTRSPGCRLGHVGTFAAPGSGPSSSPPAQQPVVLDEGQRRTMGAKNTGPGLHGVGQPPRACPCTARAEFEPGLELDCSPSCEWRCQCRGSEIRARLGLHEGDEVLHVLGPSVATPRARWECSRSWPRPRSP